MWFSADGSTWSRHGIPQASEYTYLEAVTTGGPGYIAVGYDAIAVGPENPTDIGDQGMVWTSSDGVSWVRADGEIFLNAQPTAVVADASRALVFANVPELAIWSTPSR